MESLLSATIEVTLNSKAVKPRDLKRVTVDTTVQEKAIAFPTDSKLYNRARERLVRLCTPGAAHASHHNKAQDRAGPGDPRP